MTDFSYQLYSSRNFPPLTETLKMLKRAGYASVEGYGALYADEAKVAELKAHLGDSGLTMPTGHFGLDMIEQEPARVLEIAKALDIETIYCPYLQPDDRPDTGAAWVAFGRRLQEAGKPYPRRRPRLRLAQPRLRVQAARRRRHPAGRDLRGRPGPRVGGRSRLGDKGGGDPVDWVKTFGKRLTAVHVKDIAPAGQNADEDGWADVGQGMVDWKGLMAALRSTDVKYFIDRARQPEGRRALRRTVARCPQGPLKENRNVRPRHRHHRLRQHLHHLLQARAALPRAGGPRLLRHEHGRRHRARRRVRRQGRNRSTSCSPTRTSTWSST